MNKNNIIPEWMQIKVIEGSIISIFGNCNPKTGDEGDYLIRIT